MALVTRFEDLQAWQAARQLAGVVQRATHERHFRRDRNLSDQLRRGATSTVTNIAEGFGSGSPVEFQRFLRYAIRSAVEVQSCLYLAVDQTILGKDDFEQIYAAAERVKSLCSALVRRLEEQRSRRHNPKPGRVSEAAAKWIVNQPRTAYCDVSTSARQYVHTSIRGGGIG